MRVVRPIVLSTGNRLLITEPLLLYRISPPNNDTWFSFLLLLLRPPQSPIQFLFGIRFTPPAYADLSAPNKPQKNSKCILARNASKALAATCLHLFSIGAVLNVFRHSAILLFLVGSSVFVWILFLVYAASPNDCAHKPKISITKSYEQRWHRIYFNSIQIDDHLTQKQNWNEQNGNRSDLANS